VTFTVHNLQKSEQVLSLISQYANFPSTSILLKASLVTKHRPYTTDKEAYSAFLSAFCDIVLLFVVFLVVVEFGIVLNLQNFLD
jgi:hypothetical protein